MITLTVKIPQPLAARLEAMVRRSGQRRSEIVREAIERAVEEGPQATAPSAYDLVEDLIQPGKGPKDLSSNPKHMRGYGS